MGMVRKLPEPESAQYDMYVSFEGLVNSRKNCKKHTKYCSNFLVFDTMP